MNTPTTTTKINCLATSEKNYPLLLKEINQPPNQLYIRGNGSILNNKNLLAVVGSRKPSAAGQQALAKILPDAVNAGIVVVSGLAFGIDSLAHRISVKNKQPTVAVLGTSIDDPSIYPRSHTSLAHQIIANNGAVISEYATGEKIYKSNFLMRNRIIAGLCRATLIVQAARRSGSLTTARLALESNRDVCAVPGSISDPLSEGTNNLIKQGAAPITNTEDLLNLFEINPEKSTIPPGQTKFSSPEQEELFNLLSHEPQHIDKLCRLSKLPAPVVSGTLLELEIQNLIQNIGGMKYVKSK